jgi:diguanylate cyclase (GGDEF)-like protein
MIVSDQEWASRSLDTILAPNGYAILRAHNARETHEQVGIAKPDVIFLDALLPDMEGITLCRQLRDSAAVLPSTPIFLLRSGLVGQGSRVDALEAGAWDVLGFPIDARELIARLRVYLHGKLAADQAETAGLVDPLTGVYSWKGILRRVEELGVAAKRHRRALTCIVFTPDGLQQLGGAGPEAEPMLVFREVAETIRKAIRTSDILGRLGLADLVVLAPETGPQGAEILSQRVEAALQGSATGSTPLTMAGPPRIKRGVYAVDDFRSAGLDPVEVLVLASRAARGSWQANGPAETPAPVE